MTAAAGCLATSRAPRVRDQRPCCSRLPKTPDICYMLDEDSADSPMASYRPDIEGGSDTLLDFVSEAITRFDGLLPTQLPAFRALCLRLVEQGLAEAERAGVGFQGRNADVGAVRLAVVKTVGYLTTDEEHAGSIALIVFSLLPASIEREAIMPETLRLVARMGRETVHARAAAILKQLGHDGRSDEAIGLHYGVSRAAIQGHREVFEKATGILCGANKAPEFRHACRERRLGARKTERPQETAANIYAAVFRRRYLDAA